MPLHGLAQRPARVPQVPFSARLSRQRAKLGGSVTHGAAVRWRHRAY